MEDEKILDYDRDWDELKKELLPEASLEEADAYLDGMLALVMAN